MHANSLTYVLLTAARNEATLIERTLSSVASQTIKPLRWIIVDDGSTDETNNIVHRYIAEHGWIELLRMPEHRHRHFAAKAACINAGYKLLANAEFDIVANLDADVSFEPDYFEFLLGKFAAFPRLGVAGTPYMEASKGGRAGISNHAFTNAAHVSGQCQVFRRECFEEVGGYLPIKGGAIDWVAVTTARMKGWKTTTFSQKTFFHHRKMGSANQGVLRSRFHYGRKAYYVGGHPIWEILRGFFVMKNPPRILGGLCFQVGYLWALCTRLPRPVSSELIRFHRNEQMHRLRDICCRLIARAGRTSDVLAKKLRHTGNA